MNKDFLTADIRQLVITPEKWKLVLPGDNYGLPLNHEEDLKNPGQSHSHREIMLSLYGNCNYRFDRNYYNCNPGMLFLIDRNIEHGYLDLEKTEKLLHLWVYFLEDHSIVVRCIEINYGKIKMFSAAIFAPENGLDLELLWDRMTTTSTKQEQIHQLQVFKLALAVRFGQFLESSELSRDQYHLLVVESARERIKANFRNKINVAHLAKIFGYTRFHFVRIFREITGGTIQDYINHCRIKELEKLQKQNLLQKEIAARLGFENSRSYYKWRKKHIV